MLLRTLEQQKNKMTTWLNIKRLSRRVKNRNGVQFKKRKKARQSQTKTEHSF